jgi:hypothetical protein
MILPPTTNRRKPADFGQRWFGRAELGDKRRTERLVFSANQLVQQPGRSLPDTFSSPADLKGLYRLMEKEEVTHATILRPAQQETLAQMERIWRESPQQVVLVLHDDTELDYSNKPSLRPQLGQVGNGGGRGYICHNSLVIQEDGAVLGLANQILHRRPVRNKKETDRQRRERLSRESRLWLQGTAPLPSDRRVVDVCDAAADTFEFLEHEFHSGRRFVIRSGYRRTIQPGHEGATAPRALRAYVRGQRACGGMAQNVPAQQGREPRKARRAKLLVSFTAVRIVAPKLRRGEHGREALPVWMVRVWEPYPPAGEEPIEWFLWTNEPVESFADALRVIGWYTRRWTVEEYHKGQKTGYGIERCQFTSTARLEPMIALLSVAATALLALRDACRREDAHSRRATTLFPREYVIVLSQWRWGEARPELSVYDFCYALARLGGHQNRRHDKFPGWQVLWRGWQKLQAMVTGHYLREKCGQT